MSAIKVKNPHVAGRIRTSHIKSVLIAVCDIYIYIYIYIYIHVYYISMTFEAAMLTPLK